MRVPKICMGCMEGYEDEFEICPYCGYVEGTDPEELLHIEPGSILRERYIVGKVLGYGGFGVTYIGWDATLEQKVAIKEYLPSEFSTRIPGQTQITIFEGKKGEQFQDGLEKFIEEAQRLAKFHSEEGIVRIYDSFTNNNTAYIIMEYLQGETLAEYLKREKVVPATEAIEMLLPVIHSLKVVNEKGILHRDIAPDNIFLTTDGKIKVIDFGAARFATTSHSRSLTVIIKPGYSPEEQYRSRGDQGAYTDVYAIGATLYRMITGIAPPDALERRAQFEGKRRDILKPIGRFTKDITENQEVAILNALNVRIEDRTPNMESLVKELTTEEPEKVERLHGKIRKIDVLKWPLWAKAGIIAATFAVTTLSALLMMGMIGFDGLLFARGVPEGMTRVPSIIGKELPVAEERLSDATLIHLITGMEMSEHVPIDLVLSQGQSAGAVVLENTVVGSIISGGAETEIVPNVIGSAFDDAQNQLVELDFVVQIDSDYCNEIEAGGIIYQDIEPGTILSSGEIISLVISRGTRPEEKGERQMIAVPDFVGVTFDDALNLAGGTGFTLLVTEREYSEYYEEGIILSQNIEAGTEVMTGGVVLITLSLGAERIKVPNVRFMEESSAIKYLEEAGFGVGATRERSEYVAEGLVISQTPGYGTMAEPNHTVSIVISEGPTAFEMPNTIGMIEEEGRATLVALGLSVSLEYRESASLEEGTIIDQSVVSGEPVTRGTNIRITVVYNGELIQVANVEGKTGREATDTLRGQGFNVLISEAYSDDIPVGEVISQSPGAGSTQRNGALIVITVSSGPERITVPNVVGRAGTTAQRSLESLGFRVRISTVISETVPAGSVISQSPLGERVQRGTTIYLEVSAGREPTTVKDVVGESRANADTTLREQGFIVIIAEDFSETVPEGYVISQNPEAGETASMGTPIVIRVSRGRDAVTRISIESSPIRTTYYSGQSIDTEGLSLAVRWTSGRTTIVDEGFEISPTILDTVGTQDITVTYEEQTTTFYVSVEEDTVTGISVENRPSRTTYYLGQNLDITGLTLTVRWASGQITTVNGGFEVSPTNLSTIGTQTITVTYEGQTTTFDVTVQEPVVQAPPPEQTPGQGSGQPPVQPPTQQPPTQQPNMDFCAHCGVWSVIYGSWKAKEPTCQPCFNNFRNQYQSQQVTPRIGGFCEMCSTWTAWEATAIATGRAVWMCNPCFDHNWGRFDYSNTIRYVYRGN